MSTHPKSQNVDRALRGALVLTFVLGLPACDKPPTSTSTGDPDAETNYAVVGVYYGTDRNYTGADHPRDKYGPDRGEQLYWGKCEVSIPRDHRMGELESPSIWRFELRKNPEKHVVLLDGVRYSKGEFMSDIATELADSTERKAFVFVHGYNVTFEDAARRTAQMSYDLSFDGPAMFFSWPSNGNTASYPADESDIEWATPHLTEFLSDVARDTDAESIYLVAHSMGNRGVTRALMAMEPELRRTYREIILTAPDVDADIFRRDILPAITSEGSRVTLYASSNDLALKASRKVHQTRRAGEAGEGLVVLPGLDTIDASTVETGFLGHSYYAENRSVISDLYYLINEGKRPVDRFGLEPLEKDGQTYWTFRD